MSIPCETCPFCIVNTFISHCFLSLFSLRGMVVVKGRRPDGTVDDAEGYDTGEESDEEEGLEVPLDGTKVCDYTSFCLILLGVVNI